MSNFRLKLQKQTIEDVGKHYESWATRILTNLRCLWRVGR
jgi:hypothetical protein